MRMYLLLLALLMGPTQSLNVSFSLSEEMEAELSGNHTWELLTEDDESFQDQDQDQDQDVDFVHARCSWELLLPLSHSYCGQSFHQEMLDVHAEDWCHLESIIRPYNELTLCLEMLSHYLGCYFPNTDIQDFFLNIHSTYFQQCTEEELPLDDAPHWLVVGLTLLPVSILPVLVSLVVWKSKASS